MHARKPSPALQLPGGSSLENAFQVRLPFEGIYLDDKLEYNDGLLIGAFADILFDRRNITEGEADSPHEP